MRDMDGYTVAEREILCHEWFEDLDSDDDSVHLGGWLVHGRCRCPSHRPLDVCDRDWAVLFTITSILLSHMCWAFYQHAHGNLPNYMLAATS